MDRAAGGSVRNILVAAAAHPCVKHPWLIRRYGDIIYR
jgi:hypothetical protein